MHASTPLPQAFLEGVVVAGDATQLHVLAGRVFEACDAAKTPPLDNRTAVGRALTALLRSCTDPLREARELIDGGKQAGAHDERPAAVDADFEADECSPQVQHRGGTPLTPCLLSTMIKRLHVLQR